MISHACLVLLCLLCANPINAQVRHTLHIDENVHKLTINRWIGALDARANVSSETYVAKLWGGEDNLHVTKHRDLILWIPKTTDLSRDFKVILWFHGHWGYVQERTFQDRILKQFVSQALSGKQFVVALPEMPWSVNTRTPTKRNGKLWTKPGDFLGFVRQVEGLLEAYQKTRNAVMGKIDYRIVGHSAGGSTIATVAHTGDLCAIKPSMVVWSDSSYGRWLEKAWDGCLGTDLIPTHVFVRKGGPPWKSATRMLGQFQGQPKFLLLHVKSYPWTHKSIGNNIVSLSGVLD